MSENISLFTTALQSLVGLSKLRACLSDLKGDVESCVEDARKHVYSDDGWAEYRTSQITVGYTYEGLPQRIDDMIKLIGGVDPSDALCTWGDDSEGNWHTACGEIFTLLEGTPSDNKMRHCPYCGKHLTSTETVE